MNQMKSHNYFLDLQPEMQAWRRDIHAHPETAFEEVRTANVVAEKLKSFGIEVHTGLARTGVVGSLKNGDGPAIGLRADMDALDVTELNDFGHKSTNHGKMHACGHDGHTTMLLGAAKYLAETRNFQGTVHFIFQPAEENEGGGRVMVEEGLFEKFPCEGVYGLHNWPGMPVGSIGTRVGPLMAAFDIFEITVNGKGAHAAMPHMGNDAVLASAQIVTALQQIASRNVNPLEAAVVSVTQIHGGDAWNVLPDSMVLRGCTRSFQPQVQDMIEERIGEICRHTAAAFRAEVTVRYERRYPATINTEAETGYAAAAAQALVGAENVVLDPQPTMGSEDFAFMLQAKPGCYVWLGNGPTEGSCLLHNPHYDFNDEALPVGAAYWVTLTEQLLSA